MLLLYYHPLASFCHKVLIALYESGTPFEARLVDLADEASSAELFEKWPVGKIPVLSDTSNGRVIPETSIIIEYLQSLYPGAARLLPESDAERLDVRLWDRFFDFYVSVPMQKIVLDRLRQEGERDPIGVAEARETLKTAYGMAERQLAGRRWIAGDDFTMADCSAFPALFYAVTLVPFGETQTNLAAYFERLLDRPSVARVVDEARPYFQYYPYREALAKRFYEP